MTLPMVFSSPGVVAPFLQMFQPKTLGVPSMPHFLHVPTLGNLSLSASLPPTQGQTTLLSCLHYHNCLQTALSVFISAFLAI